MKTTSKIYVEQEKENPQRKNRSLKSKENRSGYYSF